MTPEYRADIDLNETIIGNVHGRQKEIRRYQPTNQGDDVLFDLTDHCLVTTTEPVSDLSKPHSWRDLMRGTDLQAGAMVSHSSVSAY